MADRNVGCLPLYDKDKTNLAGIITDRDIVVRGIAKGLDLNTKVCEVMNKQVFTVSPDMDLMDAANLMKEKGVGRLIVAGGDKKIIGVISLADVVKKTKDPNLAMECLCHVYGTYGAPTTH